MQKKDNARQYGQNNGDCQVNVTVRRVIIRCEWVESSPNQAEADSDREEGTQQTHQPHDQIGREGETRMHAAPDLVSYQINGELDEIPDHCADGRWEHYGRLDATHAVCGGCETERDGTEQEADEAQDDLGEVPVPRVRYQSLWCRCHRVGWFVVVHDAGGLIVELVDSISGCGSFTPPLPPPWWYGKGAREVKGVPWSTCHSTTRAMWRKPPSLRPGAVYLF